MRYEVIAIANGIAKTVEIKNSMDDAFDLIETMQNFDKAENMAIYDEYRVRIIKD